MFNNIQRIFFISSGALSSSGRVQLCGVIYADTLRETGLKYFRKFLVRSLGK